MTFDMKSMLELLGIFLCSYAVYKERELGEFERRVCRTIKCLIIALKRTVRER